MAQTVGVRNSGLGSFGFMLLGVGVLLGFCGGCAELERLDQAHREEQAQFELHIRQQAEERAKKEAEQVELNERLARYRQEEAVARQKASDAWATIRLGMSDTQVGEMLVGWIRSVNRSVGSWGVHEQWVYKPYGDELISAWKYLYFENGVLVSFQE